MTSNEITALNQEPVDVTSLNKGSVVTVSTRNSTYRLTIRDVTQRLASIEGGQFFSKPILGLIVGTPQEDGVVQVGVIQPGMRMEILADDRRIVTSPVLSLDVAA